MNRKTFTMLKPLFCGAAFLFTNVFVFAQGTWVQKANFGGTTRSEAIGFSIGTKGYIGTGGNTKDFWE